MKLAAIFLALFVGLLTLGLTARADYVDDADDLSPPLTETEAENHPLWDAVANPDMDSDQLDLDEMKELQIRRGDTLSEVQEVEN